MRSLRSNYFVKTQLCFVSSDNTHAPNKTTGYYERSENVILFAAGARTDKTLSTTTDDKYKTTSVCCSVSISERFNLGVFFSCCPRGKYAPRSCSRHWYRPDGRVEMISINRDNRLTSKQVSFARLKPEPGRRTRSG